MALFIYAVDFLFAYIQLSTGTAALLLFGAVQVTIMGYGFWTALMKMTAGNFIRVVSFTVGLSLSMVFETSPTIAGCLYAVAAGAITSGLGYIIWYTALKYLTATSAATVQLSVPVIAATGGILFLGEHLTLRLFVASCGNLGEISN